MDIMAKLNGNLTAEAKNIANDINCELLKWPSVSAYYRVIFAEGDPDYRSLLSFLDLLYGQVKPKHGQIVRLAVIIGTQSIFHYDLYQLREDCLLRAMLINGSKQQIYIGVFCTERAAEAWHISAFDIPALRKDPEAWSVLRMIEEQ